MAAGSSREPSAPEAPMRAVDGREETQLERLDRNLAEMTGELRVVVTGVQVLFAFLLIVPFNSGFAHAGDFERTVYFVTLLLAALAAACTIAPSAQHRFLFRHDDKRYVVFVSHRVVIAGLVFLSLAMCGSVLLVASKLFGVASGVLTAVLVGVPFATLWFAVPLRRRRSLSAARRRTARSRARRAAVGGRGSSEDQPGGRDSWQEDQPGGRDSWGEDQPGD